jgi:hypothetical protein
VIVSILDPTQPGGAQPAPLVDLDQIEPDESLLADLHKTRVTTPVTRVLLVLIVLAVGFLGGALVDRSQRSSSSSNSAQSLVNAFRRARTGAAGATGASGASGAGGLGAGLFGGGAAGGATIGTVKLVDGKNVYVQDTAGDVIKVTTDAGTQVTVSKPGTVQQLAPGSTVIVQGTTSSDGSSMTATSITPSTGFGGRGNFANASAAAG